MSFLKLPKEMRKVSYKRIIWYLLCLGLSPYIAMLTIDNIDYDKTIQLAKICIQTFPVLFGFLLTAMTLSGTIDNFLSRMTEEQVQAFRPTYEARLIRQALLGIIYLLNFILPSIIVTISRCSIAFSYVEFAFYTILYLGLLLSLAFPIFIFKTFMERYDNI